MQHSSLPRGTSNRMPLSPDRASRRHGDDGGRRHRSHARAQRCHEQRCEEADQEIRDVLRRS